MRSFLIILTSIIAIILSRIAHHDALQSSKNNTFLDQSELHLLKDENRNFRDTILTVRDTIKYVFVGAKTCASTCHNSEKIGYHYDIWKKSRHSKSFEVLNTDKALRFAKRANLKGNPQEISECLDCHITGNRFDLKSFADTYSKEEGITCEACHKEEYLTWTHWQGKHKAVSRALQPNEKTCLQCHINPIHRVKKFNYEVRFAKITHPLLNEK